MNHVSIVTQLTRIWQVQCRLSASKTLLTVTYFAAFSVINEGIIIAETHVKGKRTLVSNSMLNTQ